MSIETAQRYTEIWNQRDPVDEHHEVARFTWHARAGAASGEPLAIGFDVIVLDRGKIREVVGFLDKAPKGAA